MSQPYRGTTPSSRPLPGQSHIIPLASASPQNVLNQKIIPRDFLGFRSRPQVDAISNPASGGLNTTISQESQGNVPSGGLSERDKRSFYSKETTVDPSGKATPNSDLSPSNEFRLERTRSPESLGSPISFAKSPTSFSEGTAPGPADAPAWTIMPRNSSIDSAVSSMSTSSISKAVGEAREPSPATVNHLIATAGGAENLIVHLLKDKNHVSSQNAQLWKLVEKQRTLLLGLNKDLERITKERDKFKSMVKEMQTQVTENGIMSHQALANNSAHEDPTSGQRAIVAGNDSTANLKRPEHMTNGHHLRPAQSGNLTQRNMVQDDQNKENMPLSNTAKLGLPEVHIDHAESAAVPPQVIPKLDTLMAAPPVFNIIEASPLVDKSAKGLPSNRKAPPKPLNLVQSSGSVTSPDRDTGKSEGSLVDEDDERGRRKTREDDDREREKSAIKAEAEARSRSKKSQPPKPLAIDEHMVPSQMAIPAPLPTPGLPLSPRPQHAQTFVAPQSSLGVASTLQPSSIGDRLNATPLKSPGLPMSPRPLNLPVNNSLPLSPRVNMSAMPLSPRAPKHALPVPTNPSGAAEAMAGQNRIEPQSQPTHANSPTPVDRLLVHQPIGSEPPPIYRGLVSSAYPSLLLPPNALPSIQVQVHSSRLRPSRHSVLSLKEKEESTIFSLSIISRSSNSELWRVEKTPNSLPQLEQSLRPRCPELPKMPDRRLFLGYSPALLDERRQAIDQYFDDLLDTHVDEQAAVTICRFLSTDIIEPDHGLNMNSENNHRVASPDKPITKVGYLTKKGKNFGGWKSRFFFLDGAELRYYESSGGTHLGTIRLQNALIGKQKDTEPTEDSDGQFRHAFLIQEPKRKDSTTYIRHVLCAESDAERDDWVRVLLYWVEGAANTTSGGKPTPGNLITQSVVEIEHQQSVSKSGTSMKEALHNSKDTHINMSTPTSVSSVDSSILDAPSAVKTNISGPLNGGIITDASSWGSRSGNGSSTKEVKEKTHKMSNIFGFKRPEQNAVQAEQKPPKPRILRHNGYVRAVFGLPLAEAVEFCAPFNVEVDLPAVAYRCLEYLRERNAASEEGLFRLSGSNVAVRSLKERFNTEGDVDLVHDEELHDVHAVASLFKTYLRELPSTLLTRDLHIEFLKVLELERHEDKVATYNNLVHRLPAANFTLLKEMSSYLLEVTRNADKNKMSVRNVGIVFSPTLNIPTPVFTLFLTEYASIFDGEPAHTSHTKTTEIQVAQDLTPDEIRSPRHQMFTDLPTPAPQQTTFQAPPRGTMTGTGELGFLPIHPSYESGNYVSMPRTIAVQPMAQAADPGGYNSLNGLLAPTNAASEKAKRRESAILFTG